MSLRTRSEARLRLLKIHKQFVFFTGHRVAYRTFIRYCHDELSYYRGNLTVRVMDCGPGQEFRRNERRTMSVGAEPQILGSGRLPAPTPHRRSRRIQLRAADLKEPARRLR